MTTIEQALKETADRAMGVAAGQTNLTRALKAIADSGKLTDQEFFRLAGRMPCVMEQNLKWCEDEFQRAKLHYESVCRILGVPAYATYSED